MLRMQVMRQDGVAPDIVSYNTVISALRRATHIAYMPKILALLADMRERGCEPDTISYNTALAGCCAAEDWDTAMHVLELLTQAEVEHGVRPDVVTYSTLLSLCERCARLTHVPVFQVRISGLVSSTEL